MEDKEKSLGDIVHDHSSPHVGISMPSTHNHKELGFMLKAKGLKKLFCAGIITLNEARLKLGMPKLIDGDVLCISTDVLYKVKEDPKASPKDTENPATEHSESV